MWGGIKKEYHEKYSFGGGGFETNIVQLPKENIKQTHRCLHFSLLSLS